MPFPNIEPLREESPLLLRSWNVRREVVSFGYTMSDVTNNLCRLCTPASAKPFSTPPCSYTASRCRSPYALVGMGESYSCEARNQSAGNPTGGEGCRESATHTTALNANQGPVQHRTERGPACGCGQTPESSDFKESTFLDAAVASSNDTAGTRDFASWPLLGSP
jgi:hypothetical protein